MMEGTQQRLQLPAAIGFSGNIVSFALFQYWEAGKAQFLTSTSGIILGLSILIGLAAVACWAVALKTLSEGRGQSPWFATLAVLGPLGLGILYLTEDRKERKRPHLRRHASNASRISHATSIR